MPNISKALNKNVKRNQLKFHNILAFFGLITVISHNKTIEFSRNSAFFFTQLAQFDKKEFFAFDTTSHRRNVAI